MFVTLKVNDAISIHKAVAHTELARNIYSFGEVPPSSRKASYPLNISSKTEAFREMIDNLMSFENQLSQLESWDDLLAQLNEIYDIIERNGEQKVYKQLKALRDGLAKYLSEGFIKGWLFRTDSKLPYLIESIQYKPANPEFERPARVTINLTANNPLSQASIDKAIVYHLRDIYGKSVPQVLFDAGFIKENESLHAEYEKTHALFEMYQEQFAKQFTYSDKTGRLVMDSRLSEMSAFSAFTSQCFMAENSSDPFASLESGKNFLIPMHPILQFFDLETHHSLKLTSDQVLPYVYDKDIADKLVLPDSHKDLIDILINDSDVMMDDIITGKSGGTCILCMGKPGLGKTLTAEVYSEVCEKPLYRVHSGQLGDDAAKIESNLQEVMQRAEKWGAILLIDEADTFVSERKNSVTQNAIVATFLRKMEYYNGVLFMTTNRVDDIDHAVKSRFIAIIKYTAPDADNLKRIWKTLAELNNIEIADSTIDEITEVLGEINGRDVKELLKLAYRWQLRGHVIDTNMLKHCAVFRGLL